MPEVSVNSPADRAQGDPQDMHPRLNGDLINTPDDLTEGKGNFIVVDAQGNPEGFTLGQPPKIVSRDIYLGQRADTTTKQNQVPLSLQETSYLVNSPLIDGDPLPEFLTPSGLPKPPTPTIKKELAPVAGYPASTLEKPYWIAYSWARYVGGKYQHTTLSPFTRVPPVGQGQVMDVPMPEDAPLGATHIGIWLTRPGTSTSLTPGPMSLQILVRLSTFFGTELQLKGPYIYNKVSPIPSSANETQMQIPARPVYRFNSGRWASRPGNYYFRVSAVNDLGETLASSAVGPRTISASTYWTVKEGAHWRNFFGLDPDADLPPAGYGYIRVFKPSLPTGATGWFLYVMVDNQWHRAYDKLNGHGLNSPLPVNLTSVDILGWEGSEQWAFDNRWLLGSGEPPTEDTTAVQPPDSPLEEPEVSGASRPGAGTYYARVVDRSDEEQSPPSDWASVTISNEEVMRVIPGNPANKLPNATFVEKAADGLPLSYTITQTNGSVSLEGGELIMQTTGSQTGTTPTVLTDTVPIDVHKEWSVGALLKLEDPITGAFQGSFEVVLRETSSAGGTTDTVLKSAGAVGEHRYYTVIASVDFPSGLTWQANTVGAQILYRFAGSPKNIKVRISRQLLKDYRYGFRRRELVEGAASNPNPSAETTANPSGEVALEPSPNPETTPDAFTQTGPDRPLSSGTTIETATYDNEMPPGWTSHASNATLTREAGAAISGTQGMVSRKTTGGAGHAYADKTYPPDTGQDHRNSLGDLTRHKIPTFPINGSITLKELRNSDGEKFAWIDFDNRFEVSRLTIDSAPNSSGNVITTLDEGGVVTPRNTAVIGNREFSSLTIDNNPTVAGNVSVTLGGTSQSFPVQMGQAAGPEVVEVEITRGATRRGRVVVYLATPYPNPRNVGGSTVYATIEAGYSAEWIAQALRGYANNWEWAYDYWTISGSGRKIIFTAKLIRPTPGGHRYISNGLSSGRLGMGETGSAARVRTLVRGGVAIPPDTNSDIAGTMRTFSFPGYKTGGSGATVTFEALEAGPKTDATYSDGGTGATSTSGMVTSIQGSRDSVDDVANKILTTYTGNSYWTPSRTGNVITLTALSTGAKQDATFSGGTTETTGRMEVLIQGSPDIIAYATDSSGVIRRRRIIENISTSTIVNVDLAVTGAGTPPSGNSRAVVSVWGSTGASSRTLRALFEDLDLADYPSAVAARGVSGESSSALTWEVHTDDGEVTDRGKSYYRYHDYLGELLNQVHSFFLPNQPVRDDLFLHDWRQAVLLDTEYSGGIYIRWDGVVGTQEPLYLYGVTPDDEVKPIGCITGGITGSGAWQHKQITFTTPPDVHEIRLDSRRIGPGEMVIQELADSVGSIVKRTLAYATAGSYTATLDIGTPADPGLIIGRTRKILESDIEIPTGSTADMYYSSADTKAGSYSTPTLDSALVPQRNVIKVELSTTSNGLVTPVLKSGSPRAEYILRGASDPLGTFLKEDRTELDGGAFFVELDEYAEPPEVVTRRLPGGRYYRTITFGPVGQQPAFSLQVFTPEARKYIEDRSQIMDFVIEEWGKILTLRFSGKIRFTRQGRDIYKNDRRYNHYIAEVPEAEVVEIRDLPQG